MPALEKKATLTFNGDIRKKDGNGMAEVIDGNTLRRVRNMLKRGEGAGRKIRDSSAPGLTIRVYKNTASWAIVNRDSKVTIGDLALFSEHDLPALRELVAKAREYLARGDDARPLVKAFVDERDVEKAGRQADVALGLHDDWETARDKFLDHIRRNRADDTYRSYRSALGANEGSEIAEDFAPVRGRPMGSIEKDHLIDVRDNILNRGRDEKGNQVSHVAAAKATVRVLKAMWAWALNQKGSGLTVDATLKLSGDGGRVVRDTKRKAEQERSLLQEELGLILLGLEYYPNVSVRWCEILQLFTGQRRMTATKARGDDFIDHPQYGMVWRLEDKVGHWRALPLPEMARLAVENARSGMRYGNEFLFPQQRARRKGDPMDGHVNERTVSEALLKMRMEGGVLHGLPVTPATHDLRRALISRMGPRMHRFDVDGQKLNRKDIAMVTHRDEGREETASRIYDLDEYLPVKHQILAEWEQFVLEGYYKAKERWEADIQERAGAQVAAA